MIPLYVLVGVWGGPAGWRATLKFVHLHDGRVAADARLDHRLRAVAEHVRPACRSGTSVERLDLPRLRRRVRDQGAALPAARLAAGRVPRVVARGCRRCSRASSRRRPRTASCGSRSRSSPSRRSDYPRADPRARGDRADLRLAARVPRARHPRRDRVLVARADGPDHDGPLRASTTSASTAPCCQMVNHGLVSATLFLLAGMVGAANARPVSSRGSAGWRAGDRRSRRCC